MGPAHPGHCRGCGPLSPVGRSGGGSTGRPRSCVGDGEGIMNCGTATVFLPNFVGFPSLRGLHSSTVQPERTPRPNSARRCVRAPTGCASRRALVWDAGPPQERAPRRGCGSPRGSSAAPCQLPPPHPPPPPPPQDEPPPQEWPEWCPSEDEPPSPPPAHQLFELSPPPDDHECRPRFRPADGPLRAPDLRAPFSSPPITRAANTIRMMPKTMASPSFHFPGSHPESPEATPRRAPRSPYEARHRARCDLVEAR